MNPPTPGHLYVIQTLIEQGIAIGVPQVYVILSKTNDNNENPIPCPDKIDVLGTEEKINVLGTSEEKEEVLTSEDRTNNMIYSIKHQMKLNTKHANIRKEIDNIEVITKCVSPTQRSPFTPLYGIVKRNNNLILVIGEDRKYLVYQVSDAMFKINAYSVKGIILGRENMDEYKSLSHEDLLKINISELPVSAISASFVRNLVKYEIDKMEGIEMDDSKMYDSKTYHKFFQLYSPYLDKEKIQILYKQIWDGLFLPDPKPNREKSKSAIIKELEAIKKLEENNYLMINPMSNVQSNPVESVFLKVQNKLEEDESSRKESESSRKRRKSRKRSKSEESELKEDESSIKRRQSRKRSKSEESEFNEKSQSELKEDESSRKISKSEESESIERAPKKKMQSESSGKRRKKGGKKTKKRVY
jgi:hypothetical protein